MIKRLENIKKILENKKATNVDIIDLENKNYVVNSVIIATTLNSKHGDALLNYLKEELKPKNEEFLRVEQNDNWIIIDLGDIFIHLMSEDYRNTYKIEEFLEEIIQKENNIV